MSTYVISDIHGELDKFKELMEKAGFKYGEDELHILGDCVEWKEQSIEPLLFLFELKEKYKNIFIYKGNQEDMYGRHLFVSREGKYIYDPNHFTNTTIKSTVKGYTSESSEIKDKVLGYFNSLILWDTIRVNDVDYYLSHASYYDEDFAEQFPYIAEQRVLWTGLKTHQNPLTCISSSEERIKYANHIFITGHVHVSDYGSYDENGKMKIFKCLDNNKICIDCGARNISKDSFFGSGRLGMLRLDDGVEFYVD